MNWLLECIGVRWNRRKGAWDVDAPRVIGIAIGCAASAYVISKVSNRDSVRHAAIASVPLSTFLKLLQKDEVKQVTYSEMAPFGAVHYDVPAIGACISLLVPGSYDHVWAAIAQNDCSVAAIREVTSMEKLGIGFFVDLAGLLTSLGALVYMWHGQSSDAPVQRAETSSVSFDDVAGMESTKTELKEVIEYLNDPASFEALGALPPRGILLTGPSGTGKTLLAKAVAGETQVPFIYQSAASFVEIYVGQGASRVRNFFDLARSSAPCVVFVDELDALGQQRDSVGQGCSEYCQTLNQLLIELDGMRDSKETPWCFIGATNRYHALDTALVRPGRIDRIINVPLPDIEARHGCLLIHLKKILHESDLDLWPFAEALEGWNGAEIANLVNEAALVASRRKEPMVLMRHLEEMRCNGHSHRNGRSNPNPSVVGVNITDKAPVDWRVLQPFLEALRAAET